MIKDENKKPKKHSFKILLIGFLLLITFIAPRKVLASGVCRDNDNQCPLNCNPVNDNDCVEKGVNTKMFAYISFNLNLDTFKRNIDELATQGVLWVRLPIFEWEIARTPGTVNNIPWNLSELSKYDEAINYAKSRGLKIYLVNAFPGWAKDYSHEDYKKFVRNYLDFLSKRYRGKIDIWQVFNEPDIHYFRTYECIVKPNCDAPDPFPAGYLEQLQDILSSAREVIKGNNPNVVVTTNVGGGRPFHSSWEVFLNVVGSALDAISLDIYPETDEDMINSLPQKISYYRQKYQKPVYVAEVGMNTFYHTEEEQAMYLPRYLDKLKEGRPNLILLYEYQNSVPAEKAREDNGEEAFGIKRRDGSRKLAYDAVINKLKSPLMFPYPPAILSSSCNQTCINGDSCSCTLDWGDVLGATNYPLRVDDISNEWAGTCDPSKVKPGDICIDNIVSSNYTFLGKNGRTYVWWVHAVNSLGWSDPNGSELVVNCNCQIPTSTPVFTPTPTPQQAQLSFKIKFQGISSQAPSKNVRVILKQGGVEKYRSDAVIVTSDASGIYSGIITTTPGTYDVLIKGPAHLQKKFTNITLNPGTNIKDFSSNPLKAGDFDNNNVLNIFDVGAILNRYTSLSVPVDSLNPFDIDANGVININDISLVLVNYTALEVRGDE